MFGDLIPRHVVARDGLVAAHHMRQDHGRGAGAVAVHRTHIAAERHVQEAMNLALRVVETSGAGPAIGAAEDRGGAIFGSDPRQFIRKQIEHFVPGARDEFLVEAARAACAPVQPCLAHHRPQDAGLVAHRRGEVLQDRGGRWILRVRPDIQRRAVPSCRERAPMRAVRAPILPGLIHSLFQTLVHDACVTQFTHSTTAFASSAGFEKRCGRRLAKRKLSPVLSDQVSASTVSVISPSSTSPASSPSCV